MNSRNTVIKNNIFLWILCPISFQANRKQLSILNVVTISRCIIDLNRELLFFSNSLAKIQITLPFELKQLYDCFSQKPAVGNCLILLEIAVNIKFP